VSRWVDRHRDVLSQDLLEGEQLLAAHRVEVRGNVDDAIDGERVRSRGSSRRRYIKAVDSGFPLPGPFFVIGISDRRVLFWRASPMLVQPVALEHSVPIEDIARVLVMRRPGRPHLGVLFGSGQLLVVRSLWGFGLKDLEAAFDTTR
jgi:hypothetical protein